MRNRVSPASPRCRTSLVMVAKVSSTASVCLLVMTTEMGLLCKPSFSCEAAKMSESFRAGPAYRHGPCRFPVISAGRRDHDSDAGVRTLAAAAQRLGQVTVLAASWSILREFPLVAVTCRRGAARHGALAPTGPGPDPRPSRAGDGRESGTELPCHGASDTAVIQV